MCYLVCLFVLIVAGVLGSFMLRSEPVAEVDTRSPRKAGITWYGHARSPQKAKIVTIVSSSIAGQEQYTVVKNNTQTGTVFPMVGEIVDITVSVTVDRRDDPSDVECHIQMQGRRLDADNAVIRRGSLRDGVFCSASVTY